MRLQRAQSVSGVTVDKNFSQRRRDAEKSEEKAIVAALSLRPSLRLRDFA
jgi:hypothetical protein